MIKRTGVNSNKGIGAGVFLFGFVVFLTKVRTLVAVNSWNPEASCFGVFTRAIFLTGGSVCLRNFLTAKNIPLS